MVECNERMREVTIIDRRTDVSSARKTFTYDRVFGPNSKQQEVYNAVVRPVVMEVIEGYNCTIFAYGQTGTGKTFTMEGARSDDPLINWEDDPLVGIIPRAVSHLFSALNAISNCEYSVKISYIELYNEELSDLLSESQDLNEKLRIFEDSNRKGSVVIPNLEEITVSDKKEVYKILQKGAEKRQKAATYMNAQSSRSHSIFSVTVFIKEKSIYGEETLKVGKLNLVDLAGSENIERSGATGKRAAEAGKINKSLTTLGRVITALVEHRDHIPYRESNLTRLLQDSLGGKTKTTIIATISPATCNIEETLSTLDYAHKAKSIKNKPEANQKLVKKELIREYTDEIDKLKRELLATREKNGVYLPADQHAKNEVLIETQKQEIRDLTTRINYVQDEFDKLMQQFNDTTDELNLKTRRLRETSEKLTKTEVNLKLTEQDRDENKYLLSEQVKTENSLYQQADSLLKITQLSINECAQLHDTLNRKREIEALNKITNENYYHKIKNRYLSMLQEESIDFIAKNESLGQLTNKLKDIKLRLSEDKDENYFELNSFLTTMNNYYEAQKSYINEFLIDKNQHFIMELASLNQLNLNKTNEFLNSFKEYLNQHYFELTSREILTLDNQLTILKSYLTENQEKFKAFIDELQQNSIVLIEKDLKNDINLLEVLHSSISTNENRLDNLRSYNDSCHKTSDNDYDEIQNLLNRKRKENNERYDRMKSELDQVYFHHQQDRLKVKQIADEMINNRNAFIQHFKNDMNNKLLNAFNEIFNNTVLKLNEIVATKNNFDSLNRQFKEYTNTRCDELANHLQEDSKVLGEFAYNQCDTLNNNMIKHLEAIKNGQKEQTESISNFNERYENEMNIVINSIEKPIEITKETKSSMKVFSDKLNQFMNENVQLLETYTCKEYKIDKSSGDTPKRKTYDYPTQLIRTRNHSSLLELFREEQANKSKATVDSGSWSRSSSVESRKRNSAEIAGSQIVS